MNIRFAVVLMTAPALSSCLFTLDYVVGGTVTGLRGSGLVLQDNATNSLKVTGNGTFNFSSKLKKGATYSITVQTQPSNPAQTCSVNQGDGTVGSVNVTNVIVTCSQPGRYAYVANQLDNTLSELAIDSSGFLTAIAGPIATGATPVSLAVDPDGTYLYVAQFGANDVAVYSINDATGVLSTARLPLPVGAGPTALAIDPANRYLYVANSAANTVSAYVVAGGAFTAVSGSPFAVGHQPVALAVDPGGNFLYVTNFVDGQVGVYAIDQGTGALTPISGSPFVAAKGAFSLAIDPSGGHAYVANQTALSISSYAVNATTGVLAGVTGSPLSTATVPESLAVDPGGQYVYATNVPGNGAVATYRIDNTTGALTLASSSTSGNQPLGVTVDPGGAFVYTANYGSGTVAVFNVDTSTGALTAVSGSPFGTGAGARAIAID